MESSPRKDNDEVFHKSSVSAEVAQMMIVAAMAKAHSLGVPQVVAILDESVLLKGFCPGAPLIRIEVAQNKAYTSLLGALSQDFFNPIKDDPALLAGVPHIPRIVTFGGGLPIRIGGAIGVRGGSVEQDIACTQAGLDAVGNS